MEHLNESFLAVFEHLTEAIRKLGLAAMGVDEENVRREAMDELAMGLQCLKTGEEEIRELLGPDGVGNADGTEGVGGSPKGTRTVRTPAGQTAPSIPRGSLEGSRETRHPDERASMAVDTPENTRIPDLLAKTAVPFARFEARKDHKRSLIGPGEILIEESFLQTALEAVEAVLEMAPHVTQAGDGGPSIEDEATRAFSALRAALRCGTRSIEPVDIDDTDNAEAAQ